jgi:DnaJ homolog subfamily C member 19
MPVVIAALLLGVLFFVLLGRYGRGQLRQFIVGWRVPLGMILSLVTIALGMTGRANFAFLVGCGASYLLFGTVPFIWKTSTARKGASASASNSAGAEMTAKSVAMSRSEALSVLGLREGASKDEIRAAHRRLIQQTHPDKGGTNYLAAKINEAKDVLLG